LLPAKIGGLEVVKERWTAILSYSVHDGTLQVINESTIAVCPAQRIGQQTRDT
jgi:hypothetical protein